MALGLRVPACSGTIAAARSIASTARSGIVLLAAMLRCSQCCLLLQVGCFAIAINYGDATRFETPTYASLSSAAALRRRFLRPCVSRKNHLQNGFFCVLRDASRESCCLKGGKPGFAGERLGAALAQVFWTRGFQGHVVFQARLAAASARRHLAPLGPASAPCREILAGNAVVLTRVVQMWSWPLKSIPER